MPPPTSIRDLRRDCTAADMLAAMLWLQSLGLPAFGKATWYKWKRDAKVPVPFNMIRALAHVRGCRVVIVQRSDAGEAAREA